MTKSVAKQIIELFGSGEFHIRYCDSGQWVIYKSQEDADVDKKGTEAIFEGSDFAGTNGYALPIVEWLAEALGGTVDSE